MLGELELSTALLMPDARFYWVILVPRLESMRDLHDVPFEHRLTLFDEIERVSLALEHIAEADKVNVAALGNQVPQLHIHVIARRTDDAAWPGPVWSLASAQPLDGAKLEARATRIKDMIGL